MNTTMTGKGVERRILLRPGSALIFASTSIAAVAGDKIAPVVAQPSAPAPKEAEIPLPNIYEGCGPKVLTRTCTSKPLPSFLTAYQTDQHRIIDFYGREGLPHVRKIHPNNSRSAFPS